MEAQQRTLEEETDSTVPSDTQEDRIKEQKKYGIFFEDDYDYLQHLKERQAKVELVAVSQPKKDAHDQLTLPKGLFSSKEEEEVGMLNKAAPLVGPQLDWDPDIVAAMDEDFDYLDPHNQLEDDFITMATQGEFPTLGPQVYVEHSDIDDDISGHGLSGGVRAADRDHSSGGDVDGNDDSDHKSLSSDGMSETRSRFTDYSLSSSVQPRNEGLTLLDNRFEKVSFHKYSSNFLCVCHHVPKYDTRIARLTFVIIRVACDVGAKASVFIQFW
jgi:protein LTV1